MMRNGKLGSTVVLLAAAGMVAVACGSDDDGQAGGEAGQAGEPAAAAGLSNGGGDSSGESGAGGRDGSAGDGRGGAAGIAGQATAGAGGAGGAACSFESESYAAGERFIGPFDGSDGLCTCQPNGEVVCVEQLDGCALLLRDLKDVVDDAKTCDRDGPLQQCSVNAVVDDFFCGPFNGLFTAEHVAALEGLPRLAELSLALDCDASLTPCGASPVPTESFCSDAGRCEDRWTGQNLLENGGFEELAVSSLPQKWTIRAADLPAYSVDASAKAGTNALKLSVAEYGHEYEVAQDRNGAHRFISGGSRLIVSGFYRIDALGGDVSVALRTGVDTYQYFDAPSAAGVWQEFRLTTYSAGSGGFSVGLVVEQNSGPFATVSFDDVSVELATP